MKTFRISLGSMCNFNCTYCYEKNKKNKIIETEVLNNILSYINKNIKETYSVIFFGGEPTLYMDKIEYFVSNCKNKNTLYSIFTNGSNMESLLNLEKKYNIYIGKIVSNKTETDIYNYTDIRIKQFNLILTPETMQYIDDKYINFLFSRKNIEYILIVFCIESDWSLVDENLFIGLVNKLNTKYLLNKNYSNFLYLNSLDRNDNYVTCCILDILNIGTDGNVYLCNRHMNIGTPDEKGIIGNVKTDNIDDLFIKKNQISNIRTNSQDCYYFENLGIDRTLLMSLINKTNLYIKDQDMNISTMRTRCGSCTG